MLVQGDTGPGNFVFEHGNVTGIVDWEFAHIRIPMDDWAWLDMRMPGEDLTDLQARYTVRPVSRSTPSGSATTAPRSTTGAR